MVTLRRLTPSRNASASMGSGRALAMVFIISLFVYSLAVLAIRFGIEPTGDEPHYLVATRSIVYDLDLDLRNNYLDKHWKAFYGGDLGWEGHAYQYAQSSTLTTIHPIGLPVFLAIPYFLASRIAEVLSRNSAYAGYIGSVVTMVLTASILATVSFKFISELVKSRLAAYVAWAVIFLTNPLLPYSSQLFPEELAAVVIMIGLWLSWRGPRGRVSSIVAGITVAALPWIHFRFLPLMGILFIYLAIQLWHRYRQGLFLVLGINAASVVGLALYSLNSYGSISPTAAYSSWGEPLSLKVLPVGLPGLLIDQSHGLFVYAPIYALVLVVWLALLVKRVAWQKYLLTVSLLLFLAEALVSAMHPIWTGGWSIPPRFLVPVVPLAALPFAVSLEIEFNRVWRRAFLGIAAVLCVATFAVTIRTSTAPDLYFNNITGKVLIVASKRMTQITGSRILLNDYWPMMESDSRLNYRPLRAWEDTKRGLLVKNESAPFGEELTLDPERDGSGPLTGPLTNEDFIYLTGGRRVAKVYLRIDDIKDDSHANDVVAVLDSATYSDQGSNAVVSREIRLSDFGQSGAYQAFDLEFPYSGFDPLRVRVLYTGKAKMWFGGMTLERR